MQDIKELSLRELESVFTQWGEPVFHAQQVMAWIYKKSATDFDQMSNLSLDLRKRLKENFYLLGLKIVETLCSQDRTAKFLFELRDKNFIEAVSIPTEKRITACLSTQVGCKFTCSFCASGLLGFKRNLTSGEMLEEVLYLNPVRNTTQIENNVKVSNGVKNNSKNKKLTHLVFMGIGEPLDNYDNVLGAIRIINSSYAFNIGARRMTISTCGIIPAIERLAGEGLQIELSISLHASDDKTRSQIMPVNKKYPIKDLINACEKYIKKTNRQITFEYVLIKGVNSDLLNAQNLIKILKDLKLCKINLIPCNPIKELNIEPPNKLEVLLFRDHLIEGGLNVTLRQPRGQDIEAACGQLRLRYA